jgi:AcrR family transcriptional regulator
MTKTAAMTEPVLADPTQPGAASAQEMSTRDRILDIALDLFIEKGFDKTSLREIADRLGFSKAAIYYHFASKEDILMALHLRLHEFGHRAIERLGQAPVSMDSWARLLDETIGEMLLNRKIFVMHERNRAAFEQLHRQDHDQEHEDLEEQLRRVMADPTMPLRDRVRMACAIGAIMTGLVLSGELLKDVPSDQLGDLMRDAVGDLLGRRSPVRSSRSATAARSRARARSGGRA